MNGFQKSVLCLLLSLLISLGYSQDSEMVYAEMEFPLSFVSNVRDYRFNPLDRFQTEVEGRIMELTSDPLVDIYQVTEGRQAYRSCLAIARENKLRTRTVLEFSFQPVRWSGGREVGFDDVWFSLEYRKLNPRSWGGSNDLIITQKSNRVFDAFLGSSPNKAPKQGEFYFPIVNREVFFDSQKPSKAMVNKSKQKDIGYGRYTIDSIEENRQIRFSRRTDHPYYKDLNLPGNVAPVNRVRMVSFPRARINRNEQFIEGRVHLITSATQGDTSYIENSLGKENVKVSRYSDDSFSGFVFNCEHPYLKIPAIRRALNYAFRKKLALRKALGGEGELISAPLPRRNFFYNITVRPYEDDANKAIALLDLYRNWGLDVYERGDKLFITSSPVKGPMEEIQAGDQIIEIERKKVNSLTKMQEALNKHRDKPFRIKFIRGKRVVTRKIDPSKPIQLGLISSLKVKDGKVSNFPTLELIANNPEGKNALVKSICGAFKEDLAKLGIPVKINYLDGRDYYPRLEKAKFDVSFRTLKLTGTPNLYRLYYKDLTKEVPSGNTNYGNYYNATINDMAWSTRNITDTNILTMTWKKAHQLLHDDPPMVFLWSRRHIVLHDPNIEIITPGPEYKVPHGYKRMSGLINIFNEVHLWAVKKR